MTMKQIIDCRNCALTLNMLDEALDSVLSRYSGRAINKTILVSPVQHLAALSAGLEAPLSEYRGFKWIQDVGMLDDGVIIQLRGFEHQVVVLTNLDISTSPKSEQGEVEKSNCPLCIEKIPHRTHIETVNGLTVTYDDAR